MFSLAVKRLENQLFKVVKTNNLSIYQNIFKNCFLKTASSKNTFSKLAPQKIQFKKLLP